MSEISINTLKTMLANLDDAKKYQSLRDVMETLPAPDLAAVFEDLPTEKLPVLFRLCPKDLAAEVFTELTPQTQQALIDGLTDTELKAVVDDLFVDDATDLVEEMPANVVKRILAQADPATRRMINELLKYPEDSAGGVMTTELMELRPDMTVQGAMEAIRKNGFDKETINNCYVTDASRKLVGVVSLRALVLAKDTNQSIQELMDTNVVSVTTTTGGVGTVPGVLVGVLVFELMKVALQFMNVNSSYTYIVQGLVIIVAVAIDIRKYLAKK